MTSPRQRRDSDRYCQLCNAWFNNPGMAQQHYDGKKHKKNAARADLLEQLGKTLDMGEMKGTEHIEQRKDSHYIPFQWVLNVIHLKQLEVLLVQFGSLDVLKSNQMAEVICLASRTTWFWYIPLPMVVSTSGRVPFPPLGSTTSGTGSKNGSQTVTLIEPYVHYTL